MKIFPIFVTAMTISSCGLMEIGTKNSNGLISKSKARKAISNATLIQDVQLRGQVLKISRADLDAGSFAVLQFIEGVTGRRDQAKMAGEVIPIAEQTLGCSIIDRRKFDQADYMPRNDVLVLPIECVDTLSL